MMKKKKLMRFFIVLLSLVLITELVLRFAVDLGAKPLYVVDENCEYRLQPNQDISRFHNDFKTNANGMRSPEISDKDKKRILLFGDSVINGGSKVDQSELVSSILIEKLSAHYNAQVNVCNISAGSWGPENAYQFYANHVDFNYDMVILLFSSHDYHDNMHFRDVVGEEPAWPDHQPLTAIGDVISNFLIPKLSSKSQYDYLEGFDDSPINPGWSLFINESKKTGIPLLVYLHPEVSELKSNAWNQNGTELQNLLDTNNVNWINGITFEKESDYLDNVHLDGNGHRTLADVLFNEITMLNW